MCIALALVREGQAAEVLIRTLVVENGLGQFLLQKVDKVVKVAKVPSRFQFRSNQINHLILQLEAKELEARQAVNLLQIVVKIKEPLAVHLSV